VRIADQAGIDFPQPAQIQRTSWQTHRIAVWTLYTIYIYINQYIPAIQTGHGRPEIAANPAGAGRSGVGRSDQEGEGAPARGSRDDRQ